MEIKELDGNGIEVDRKYGRKLMENEVMNKSEKKVHTTASGIDTETSDPFSEYSVEKTE